MSTSTKMTMRLPVEVKSKLSRLADATRRSKSRLVAEAVADYVDRELAIIEGIQRGEADVKAGRVTTHGDIMGRARKLIEEARSATNVALQD
jgi:predicted transcriptional regulator